MNPTRRISKYETDGHCLVDATMHGNTCAKNARQPSAHDHHFHTTLDVTDDLIARRHVVRYVRKWNIMPKRLTYSAADAKDKHIVRDTRRV